MEISQLRILLKQTVKKAPLKLVREMKAINTMSNSIILNDKVLYTDINNPVIGMQLINKNEKLEFIGFSKIEIEDKNLKLTK